tara:strand:- start:5809 stop:6528 length:720 start_codon:yes stop_codon:yes gene_type:complete
MMKIVVFLFIIVAAVVCHAEPTVALTKNILILIGYADDHHVDGKPLLFSHIHHTQIAVETENVLKRFLTGFQFQQNGSVFSSGTTQITLLNANVLCPGESLDQTQHRRVSICSAQRERSELIMRYLESHVNQFDEFYYIGHARKGHGLGAGPFTDEYTFPFKFHNDIELGHLKKIVLGSCDSIRYYSSKIYSTSGVEFVGIEGEKLWMQDQLTFLVDNLFTALIADFQKNMTPLQINAL